MGDIHADQSDGAVAQEAAPFRFLWYAGEWPTAISALRHANFRYFWYGQLISLIGTWMQNTAQGWLVFDLAQQEYGKASAAFYVGIVGALGTAPMFVLTLFAGVFSDRYNRRNILIATQTVLGLLAAGLAVLVGAGHARLWHVAVFAALSGLAMAFDMPTRQAFVKDMATPRDLLNAIALNSSAFNLARIIGPGIAGWLISMPSVGVPGVLYINAVSYLAVIAGLLLIRFQPTGLLAKAGSIWQHLGEGFRYVAGHPLMRLVMVLMAVYSVFGFSYGVLMPIFANHMLKQEEFGFGMLMAATGVGAFIAAVLLATIAHRVRKGQVLLAGGLVFTLSLIAFSQSTSFLLSLALLPLVGGGFVVSSASINSAIQQIVPDHLRGRVVSIWAFIFAGFAPIGALYAGTAARLLGAPAAALIGGVVCLLMLVYISIRAAWLWRLD
ncbi:MAG: MFS transporter [Armatimonadota bacterium]